jgi:hypothetical protein
MVGFQIEMAGSVARDLNGDWRCGFARFLSDWNRLCARFWCAHQGALPWEKPFCLLKRLINGLFFELASFLLNP